jgi:hypothetical protein
MKLETCMGSESRDLRPRLNLRRKGVEALGMRHRFIYVIP